jgi:hypothetical protein
MRAVASLPVSRALLAFAAVLALAGCGSSNPDDAAPPPQATSNASEQSVCPSEQEPGIVAVFGETRTQAGAQELVARAEAVGFRGLVIQRRACDRFAVVLPGLRHLKQAADFQREAESAGFPVEIECRSHAVEGGLVAVFGHRPTRRQALALRAEAEAKGFRGLRVVQDRCSDWEVDLYGLKTPAQRHELAQEARQAGLRVAYELG